MPRTNKNQEWLLNADGSTTLVREQTVTVPDSVIAREKADAILSRLSQKAETLANDGPAAGVWTPAELRDAVAALILKLSS